MFQFGPMTMKVGGKVLIPDSEISKTMYGTIEEVNVIGIRVRYFKGTTKEQSAFYRFSWLQDKYGPKPTKPKIETLCKDCQRFTRFCQCEEMPDDELPTNLQ